MGVPEVSLLASSSFPLPTGDTESRLFLDLRVKLRNTCWVDLTPISSFFLLCSLVHTLLCHPLHYDVWANIELIDLTAWQRTNSPRKGKKMCIFFHVRELNLQLTRRKGLEDGRRSRHIFLSFKLLWSCTHSHLHCSDSTACTPWPTMPGAFHAMALAQFGPVVTCVRELISVKSQEKEDFSLMFVPHNRRHGIWSQFFPGNEGIWSSIFQCSGGCTGTDRLQSMTTWVGHTPWSNLCFVWTVKCALHQRLEAKSKIILPQNCDFAISGSLNNLLSYITWYVAQRIKTTSSAHKSEALVQMIHKRRKKWNTGVLHPVCMLWSWSCCITGTDFYLLHLCPFAVGQIITCSRKMSTTLGVVGGGNMSLKTLQYYLSAGESPEKRQFLQGPRTGSSMWRQLNS